MSTVWLFLHTGDQGFIDWDEFITISKLPKETMVKDTMVKVKVKGKGEGHWYSQDKLEDCIVGHGKIEDCAGLHQAWLGVVVDQILGEEVLDMPRGR